MKDGKSANANNRLQLYSNVILTGVTLVTLSYIIILAKDLRAVRESVGLVNK